MQQFASLADLAAERLDDRLVPEADAERGGRRREPADDLDRRARVCRAARAGGDDEMRRREPRRGLCVDRVVPPHDHFRAELPEQVHEVVGERVVIVDDQNHLAPLTAVGSRRAEPASADGSPR